MEFNFDEVVERRGSDSVKWDLCGDNETLPMWIADMDFKTAPCVKDALTKKIEHGVLGYGLISESYYEIITQWFFTQHCFEIHRDWILPTCGGIPALTASISALTNLGDKVIVTPPVYNMFFSAIRNGGCEVLESNLLYQNGNYGFDFDDLEEKARDPKARILLLCNPHNPIGRVWRRDELIRLGEICLKNNIVVIADEIHCDLVYVGHTHIPFGSLNNDFLQNSVTCTSASKTFNLAGLKTANIFVASNSMREKIKRVLEKNEVGEPNSLGPVALMAAYKGGLQWLDELKKYLYQNYHDVIVFVYTHLNSIRVLPLEATYLLWLDCRETGLTSKQIADIALQEQKVWVTQGELYGQAGEGFIRLNMACPRSVLMEGLDRLKRVFES